MMQYVTHHYYEKSHCKNAFLLGPSSGLFSMKMGSFMFSMAIICKFVLSSRTRWFISKKLLLGCTFYHYSSPIFQNYWQRFAKLQQKLVSMSEVADLLKSQVEATCDILEPASNEVVKYNKNIAATLANVVKSNYDMLKTVSKTMEELECQVRKITVKARNI